MKKVKAILYTTGEAQELQVIPFELSKDDFEKGGFEIKETKVYNETFGTETKQKVFLINGLEIFCLFFDNGMAYECHRGFRHLRISNQSVNEEEKNYFNSVCESKNV